jgi:hypothetical protein
MNRCSRCFLGRNNLPQFGKVFHRTVGLFYRTVGLSADFNPAIYPLAFGKAVFLKPPAICNR